MEFKDFKTKLREVVQKDQSPVTLKNGVWKVTDRKESWKEVASRIFDNHLDQFEKVAVDVLSEVNPEFELPKEQRYAASIHGKELKFSKHIRKGITETLVLLGTSPESLNNCSDRKVKVIVSNIILKVLDTPDWKIWGSLNEFLPIIAEASPETFLSIVEKRLQSDIGVFVGLFKQESNAFGGRNYMTGLLWALELLAWKEEYLSRVILILAELASVDKGGNWANRPSNSIISILLPWLPQTQASIDKRISSMKAVKEEFPEIAFDILLAFMPKQHQSSSGTYKPRWRDPLPEDYKPKVSRSDYWKQVKSYSEILFDISIDSLERFKKVLSNIDNLPQESVNKLIDYLKSESIHELSENEKTGIWEILVSFQLKHRKYSDAKWALSEEYLSNFDDIIEELKPTNPKNLYKRLFNKHEHELYEGKEDFQSERENLQRKRDEALTVIFKSGGIDAIVDFVNSVDSEYQAGWALGANTDDKVRDILLPKYLKADEKILGFVKGYVRRRYYNDTLEWIESIQKDNWVADEKLSFLIMLPFDKKNWNLVSDWLGSKELYYWKNVSVNPYEITHGHYEAVDKLLDVKRPVEALDCLHSINHDKDLKLDVEKTLAALRMAVKDSESLKNIDPYDIVDLIKRLQKDKEITEEDLFNLEWAYLPLLKRFQAVPITLSRKLSKDSDFFCELISYVYKSTKEKEKSKELNEAEKNIARNGMDLLFEWKELPGISEDGKLDVSDLNKWIKNVKKKTKDSGHFEVAMLKVGEVFFYSPEDESGLWIDKGVAKLLNGKDAAKIRRGYNLEVYNSRGAYTVDPTGKPEREIAKLWSDRAEKMEKIGYVRFATSLRELSKSYEQDAERTVKEYQNDQIDEL